MKKRFTKDHLKTWEKEGAVLIKSFFTQNEVENVKNDFEIIFGSHKLKAKKKPLILKEGEKDSISKEKQFLNFDNIPLNYSKSLNLIALHPSLINFARKGLKTKSTHLYQCQTWA